jgi:predicted DNA-binding transcriptional regulator YafY
MQVVTFSYNGTHRKVLLINTTTAKYLRGYDLGRNAYRQFRTSEVHNLVDITNTPEGQELLRGLNV